MPKMIVDFDAGMAEFDGEIWCKARIKHKKCGRYLGVFNLRAEGNLHSVDIDVDNGIITDTVDCEWTVTVNCTKCDMSKTIVKPALQDVVVHIRSLLTTVNVGCRTLPFDGPSAAAVWLRSRGYRRVVTRLLTDCEEQIWTVLK